MLQNNVPMDGLNRAAERIPFDLTRQLMSISSVTGQEREIGEFLASYLEKRRYRVERQPVTPDRFNILALGGEPRVLFSTHLDTVPPVLPVREDDEFLYGRGACDTKGIIAAMIEAGERLRQDGISNFGFLFLVGEEIDGIGAKTANQHPPNGKWTSEYVIVGEPTDNHLARAQKGTLMANLITKGKAAHSGYPEAGVSATEILLRVLTDCMTADWGKDSLLGQGTFNIGVLQAGERANIIAGRAMASVMVRTVESRESAQRRLGSVVGDRAEVEILSGADPQVMHVVDGFSSTVVSFGSDVPYLGNLGKPLLVGPGSILDAHGAEEKIRKQELLEGISLYERLARRLLL